MDEIDDSHCARGTMPAGFSIPARRFIPARAGPAAPPDAVVSPFARATWPARARRDLSDRRNEGARPGASGLRQGDALKARSRAAVAAKAAAAAPPARPPIVARDAIALAFEAIGGVGRASPNGSKASDDNRKIFYTNLYPKIVALQPAEEARRRADPRNQAHHCLILDRKVAAAFAPLLAPARYKGAWGGRGSGKSHFFAEQLIEDSLAERGLLSVCIRESAEARCKDSAKRLIEAKLARFGLGEAEGFKLYREQIRTPGDGLIIFQGMQDHNAESIKSLEGFKRALVEEAQALSPRSLALLRPTMRAPGSELWFAWNPRHRGDPVDAMLRGPELPTGAIGGARRTGGTIPGSPPSSSRSGRTACG